MRCDQCGFKDYRPRALKRHMAVHTSYEERKFQCPHCPWRFFTNSIVRKILYIFLPCTILNYLLQLKEMLRDFVVI